MNDIPKFEDTEEIVEEVPKFEETEEIPLAVQPQSLEQLLTPDISARESFLRGGAQGATFGFADEIEGAVKTPFSDKSYEELRDLARAEYKAAEDVNPKTFMTGDALASIAVPGASLKALSKVDKAKKLLDSYKNASKLKKGATILGAGAVEGTGRGEGEGVIEKTSDALFGAGLAGLGGAAANLGAKGIKAIAKRGNIDELEKLAKKELDQSNVQGLRSIDAPKESFSEGLEKITKNAKVQPEDLTGSVGVREGIIRTNVSPDEAYAKALNFKKDLSKSYEKNLDSLKGYAVKDPQEATVVADEMHREIVEQIDDQIKNTAGFDEKTAIDLLKKADELKDDIQVAFLSENPLKELHNLYAKYNKFAFNSRSKAGQIAQVLRNTIKKKQRNLIGELEPDVAQNLSKLDKEYSAALDLENITENFATKKRQKGDKISLSDWVGMGVLSTVTNIPGAGPAYLAGSKAIKKATGRDLSDLIPAYSAERNLQSYQNRLDKIRKLREKGISQTRSSQIIDKTLNTGSNITSSTNLGARGAQVTTPIRPNEKQNYMESQQSFMKSNPSELSGYADKVRSRYGKNGELLANQLDKASNASSQQKKALLMKILQDPGYRKMLNVDRER